MHDETAFVLLVLVFGYALVSGLVGRWYVAPALVFVLLGMALGPFGLDLLHAGPGTEGYTVLAQLALTVILFVQASALDLRQVLRRGEISFRLIIGIPLTIALNTLVALLLLPVLSVWEAVCLAAIVAPTEAAIIHALLTDRRIPERVRHALSVESGLYDGFALAALLAALALASEHNDADPQKWAWFGFRVEAVSILVGIGIGLAGGLLVHLSRRRSWLDDTWAQLAALAIALICFEVGESVHASGFVAAFTAGLAFAHVSRVRGASPIGTQVCGAAAQLLELMVFAMFGAFAVIDGWRQSTWQVVVFAVVALFAVRIITVLVALTGTSLPFPERLFIGWFGPRGIGTVVLGLVVVNAGAIERAEEIGTIVVVTVTLSLLLHSLSAPVGIRRLRDPAAVSAG
ncbi:MAG: hypothetical protein EBU23_10670 [Mycobacteriaceae bacterium]|nr:hypothetical protein [Mycobacteriaceae bacterium]